MRAVFHILPKITIRWKYSAFCYVVGNYNSSWIFNTHAVHLKISKKINYNDDQLELPRSPSPLKFESTLFRFPTMICCFFRHRGRGLEVLLVTKDSSNRNKSLIKKFACFCGYQFGPHFPTLILERFRPNYIYNVKK